MKHRILFLIILTCLMTAAQAAKHTQGATTGTSTQGALNKWVDDKGQVHYGDEVPAEYLDQKHSVLNEQGVVVKTTKSAEQLASEQQEKSAVESVKNAKLVETKKQELRDRVLLETFTTERDLDIARDDRVSAVDSQIQLAESNIKDGEKKMKDLNERIETIEKSGRKVPDNVFKEKQSVSHQLENNYKYVEAKQDERTELKRKFEEDIRRFRELKGLPTPPPTITPVVAPAQTPATAPATSTVK